MYFTKSLAVVTSNLYYAYFVPQMYVRCIAHAGLSYHCKCWSSDGQESWHQEPRNTTKVTVSLA